MLAKLKKKKDLQLKPRREVVDRLAQTYKQPSGCHFHISPFESLNVNASEKSDHSVSYP
jgi:hypothetical protein